MIHSIHIKGFKSIYDQRIELGRVNCLIGANGVGKSNILEAIGLLSAASRGRVDDESLRYRGVREGLPALYRSSFECARTPDNIWLEARNTARKGYKVLLKNPINNRHPEWTYQDEVLFREDSIGTGLARGIFELALYKIMNSQNSHLNLADQAAQSPKIPANTGIGSMLAMLPEKWIFEHLQDFSIYAPNTPTLRGVIPDQSSRAPVGLMGGRLADAFEELKKQLENDDDTLESVLSLIDWASDIDITSSAKDILSANVPRGQKILKFTDRFMKKNRNTLTAYDASEGALYVLFTAILCLAETSPRFFAIDNLDQALNPRLASRLVSRLEGWLKYAHPERQMIFTAHNPAILDGLDLENDDIRLFAIDRNSNGQTVIERIQLSPQLLALHEQYPLSRLWMMGRLGAVPNV